MADVFLSYVREDRRIAERLAGALAQVGFSVWWDRRIQPGRSFESVIEEQILTARCVVVLWSRLSVQSDFVKDEANEGKKRGVLVPALVDEVNPPLGFRQQQTANLVEWQGSLTDPEFELLREAVGAYAGPPTAAVIPTRPVVQAAAPAVAVDDPSLIPRAQPSSGTARRKTVLVLGAASIGVLAAILATVLGSSRDTPLQQAHQQAPQAPRAPGLYLRRDARQFECAAAVVEEVTGDGLKLAHVRTGCLAREMNAGARVTFSDIAVDCPTQCP